MVKIADIMRSKLESSGQARRTESTYTKTTGFNFVELYNRKEPVKQEVTSVKTQKIGDGEYAENLYFNSVNVIEETMLKAQKEEPIDYHRIVNTAHNILQTLIGGDEHLINFATSLGHEEKNPLYMHPVNTAVFALTVGIDKRFNITKLKDLGVAALLHDIGIAKFVSLVERVEALSGDERKEMQKHPVWGLEQLKKIDDISDTALRVVYEEHERLDGSGYPHGLVGAETMDVSSRLVSAVDVFEALTHNRPHREALTVHEAVKRMLSQENAPKFDGDVLRSLIKRIGLYPAGSWVKLSNGEAAVVTGINPGHALKPKVNVIFDQNGWKLKQPRTVNLTEDHTIQILKPLQENELKVYWEKSKV